MFMCTHIYIYMHTYIYVYVYGSVQRPGVPASYSERTGVRHALGNMNDVNHVTTQVVRESTDKIEVGSISNVVLCCNMLACD